MALAATIPLVLIPSQSQDLYADWLMAREVIAGGDPYRKVGEIAEEYGVPAGHTFVAPRTPAAMLLSMPLALIPRHLVPVVGGFILVGFASLTVVASARIGGVESGRVALGMPLFFLTGAGVWLAFLTHISTMALPVCLGFGWLLIRRGEDPWAGLLLAIALVLKGWPSLIPIALYVAGKRRVAWWTLGWAAGLNLAGLLLPGVGLERAIRSLLAASEFLAWDTNGSLTSAGVPQWLLGLGVAGFLWWARREGWEQAFALAIPVALLAAPVTWAMYLVALFVPLVWRRAWSEIIVLLFSWWLLPGKLPEVLLVSGSALAVMRVLLWRTGGQTEVKAALGKVALSPTRGFASYGTTEGDGVGRGEAPSG